MTGKYPQRTCGCGRSMAPRVYACGVKETPRAFKKRQRCDVCSPQLSKPRHFGGNTTAREQQQQHINQTLQNWRS